MRLRIAVAATALGLAATPSSDAAAPAGLTQAGPEAAVAVAGTGVLVGKARRAEIRVDRFPARGGEPTPVLVVRPPAGAFSLSVSLDASATTAAAVVFVRIDTLTSQPFAGPPRGPLSALGPPQQVFGDAFAPLSIAVEGDRLVRTEVGTDPSVGTSHRAVVVDPGKDPVQAVAPRRRSNGDPLTDVAGDFYAYAELAEGQFSDTRPRKAVVGNWRTGERVSETVVRTNVKDLDLRADGRLLIGEGGRFGGVLERAPGKGGLRRVTGTGRAPRYAGDAIVFQRVREGTTRSRNAEETRLFVVDPDGEQREIGVPTAKINAYSVDERRVAWQANDCVLTTRIDAEAASAPAPGACPRAEIRVPLQSTVVGDDRRIPFTARCLAAAPGGCRGSLRLFGSQPFGSAPRPLTAWLRFSIPVGESRRLVARMTPSAFRTQSNDRTLDVRGSLVDPDGRRGPVRGYVALGPAP